MCGTYVAQNFFLLRETIIHPCIYVAIYVTYEWVKFFKANKASPRPGAEDVSLYIFSSAHGFFFSPWYFSFGKAMLHGIIWFVCNLQVSQCVISVSFMRPGTCTALLGTCPDALCLVLLMAIVQFLKGPSLTSWVWIFIHEKAQDVFYTWWTRLACV